MGLNENVTYNIVKEKGLFTEHSGSSQRKEFRSPFPRGPQIKTKTKHTKRKCRFLGAKSPMFHLEARIKKQLFKLLQHFLLF